ncbi:MAG: hypothetical protein U5N58_01680 [Actinomycetota bacterium]|nr:hypothetical protein [Actinomycetota bacterium]
MAKPFDFLKKELEMYKNLIAKDGRDYAIMGGVACTMIEASWYLEAWKIL